MTEETIQLKRRWDTATRAGDLRGGAGGSLLYAAVTARGATLLADLARAGWAEHGPDFGAGGTYRVNIFFLSFAAPPEQL